MRSGTVIARGGPGLRSSPKTGKVRKKLRAVDVAVQIRTRWGEGYVLATQDADRLRRIVADMAEPEIDTAALTARVAELEADNARLASELEAAIAKLAAPPPAPPPEPRQRRTWRELAAAQAEARKHPRTVSGGGGLRDGRVLIAEFQLATCNASPIGREVLATARFDKVWGICDSRAEAQSWLSRASA